MIIDFASYDDDNTLYRVYDIVDAVDETLRMSAKKLYRCLRIILKRNTDNFRLIFRFRLFCAESWSVRRNTHVQ